MLRHGDSVAARTDTTILAAGAPVTFVSDSAVDGRVARNATFKVHLKGRLERNGVVIAEPGMPALLVILDKSTGADGVTHFTIGLSRFLTLAGDLPVTPSQSVVTAIHPGLEIPARTDSVVVDDGSHLRVRIPLPFTLSNDLPQGEFTPIPMRTYSPLAGRPEHTKVTVKPIPSPSPSPEPSLPAVPSPSPS